jgi:hypothetical protein
VRSNGSVKRGLLVRAVYVVALPFGVMQRDLALIYRRCLGMNAFWLPVTVLLVPVVLALWAFNRAAFTVLYRGMLLIAGHEA